MSSCTLYKIFTPRSRMQRKSSLKEKNKSRVSFVQLRQPFIALFLSLSFPSRIRARERMSAWRIGSGTRCRQQARTIDTAVDSDRPVPIEM